MKILLVGGGSGGHITPLLAVARKLKQSHPNVQIDYVLERGNSFRDLVQGSDDVDKLHAIFAGKFRRYHGESFLQHLLDIPTILKNIRDFFLFGLGTIESFFLLLRLRPDVVFIKGGFVGVPIGLSCALLRIPFITHDSDTVPGLANRIIGRWARIHATGMPAEFYTYPKDKMRYVGIPLAAEYKKLKNDDIAAYRKEIGVPDDALFLCVTGGSLGALRLNDAVLAIAEPLLDALPNLHIFHQTGGQGANIYQDLKPELRSRVIEKQFVDNMYAYMGAADVVLSRAGATAIAEIGALGKASILIPGEQLTGGQQSKNAAHLEQQQAVIALSEADAADADKLLEAVMLLLKDNAKRQQFAQNLSKLVKTDATNEIVNLITKQAEAR